jgi:hypothetical protein
MNIKSIELEHTNPSMGPHEKRTIVTLTVSKDDSQKTDDFINKSKINNTITLYQYLKAVQTKDTDALNLVLKNAPNQKLNQGSTISNLSFYFEDGQTIKLGDVYRKFILTHFKPDFTSYMVEKGTINHYQSDMNQILATLSLPTGDLKLNNEKQGL